MEALGLEDGEESRAVEVAEQAIVRVGKRKESGSLR